jgi:hypothetical protein
MVQWVRSACRNIAREMGLVDSPWRRVPMDVPASAFGPGSRWNFSHYFEGTSGVAARSIDDIVTWLRACEYVSDADQFHEADYWQQPCDFERRQRGDCEDFALWAWRKLIEIGIEAEFFVGRIVCASQPATTRQHAWVVYRNGQEAFLFEPAERDLQRMIQPWSAVKEDYVPHFAVDWRLVTSAFVGCIQEPL